jgi:hypothetical protein
VGTKLLAQRMDARFVGLPVDIEAIHGHGQIL